MKKAPGMPLALSSHILPGREMVKKTMAHPVNAILCSHKNDNYREYAEAWKMFITSCLLRKNRIRNLHEHCDCNYEQ